MIKIPVKYVLHKFQKENYYKHVYFLLPYFDSTFTKKTK